MKRLILVVIVMTLLLVVALLLFKMRWKFSKPQMSDQQTKINEAVENKITVKLVTPPVSPPSGHAAPLLGETILRDYANTNLPPENDLTLMSRLMENSLLLLKSAANRPLSANEDWADLFRGKNAAHEQFLPVKHIALNAEGKLIDRWATPLFFHALGGGRYEIRSAGPDKYFGRAMILSVVTMDASGGVFLGIETSTCNRTWLVNWNHEAHANSACLNAGRIENF